MQHFKMYDTNFVMDIRNVEMVSGSLRRTRYDLNIVSTETNPAHEISGQDENKLIQFQKQAVEQDQDQAHQERGIIRTVFVIRKEKDSHLV